MPGNLQKLIRPTGFEGEQARSASLRKLAEAMDANTGNVAPLGSWTQVLSRVLQSYVAARDTKKADTLDQDVLSKMQQGYLAHKAQFQADSQKLTPHEMFMKYGDDPYVSDLAKPYGSVDEAAQKEGNTYTTFNGRRILNKDATGYDEGSPNDAVRRDPITGKPTVNLYKIASSMASQLVPADGNSASMILRNPQSLVGSNVQPPYYSPQPTNGQLPFTPQNVGQVESHNNDAAVSKKGASYRMQVMDSTARDPGYGVSPVPANIIALPHNDPRRVSAYNNLGEAYMQAMARKFGNGQEAAAAYNAGPGRVGHAIASGGQGYLGLLPQATQNYAQKFSPILPGGQRSPDGQTVDGQPYWLINGVPFDNPEGN